MVVRVVQDEPDGLARVDCVTVEMIEEELEAYVGLTRKAALDRIAAYSLSKLICKSPFYFAGVCEKPIDWVGRAVNGYVVSSGEGDGGKLIEQVGVMIGRHCDEVTTAERTGGGGARGGGPRKDHRRGVDLHVKRNNGTTIILSIKANERTDNGSGKTQQEQSFTKALGTVNQSQKAAERHRTYAMMGFISPSAQPSQRSRKRKTGLRLNYAHESRVTATGPTLWLVLSGSPTFGEKLIARVNKGARSFSAAVDRAADLVVKRLSCELSDRGYVRSDGTIDWAKVYRDGCPPVPSPSDVHEYEVLRELIGHGGGR